MNADRIVFGMINKYYISFLYFMYLLIPEASPFLLPASSAPIKSAIHCTEQAFQSAYE